LGIGDWGLGPIPNPQSPSPRKIIFYILYNKYTYLSKLSKLFRNYEEIKNI
jgi:hypothetical protein